MERREEVRLEVKEGEDSILYLHLNLTPTLSFSIQGSQIK